MDRRIVALKSENPLYTVLIFHEFTFIHTFHGITLVQKLQLQPLSVKIEATFFKKRSEELHSIFVKISTNYFHLRL